MKTQKVVRNSKSRAAPEDREVGVTTPQAEQHLHQLRHNSAAPELVEQSQGLTAGSTESHRCAEVMNQVQDLSRQFNQE